MELETAKEILKKWLQEDGTIYSGMDTENYVSWTKNGEIIDIDGEFNPYELEAIVVWIKHVQGE